MNEKQHVVCVYEYVYVVYESHSLSAKTNNQSI